MKKLLLNLFLAIIATGYVSPAPCCSFNKKASKVNVNQPMSLSKNHLEDIHPMDIFQLRFN